MKRIALALLLAVSPASAQGSITVVDGDTVKVGGFTYRLMGFDTPETFYARCVVEMELGRKAALKLEELLAPGRWRIEDVGQTDKYRRRLGRLFVGDRDVADIMVEAGLARRYAGKKRAGWCGGTP